MLLNLTNHPSVNWPENQKSAAVYAYGSIEDMQFPQIDPRWDEDKIEQLAAEFALKIKEINPSAVHIMGEMTFTYRLVEKLKDIGLKCLASTTERIVTEDDRHNKISVFKFVQFRKY